MDIITPAERSALMSRIQGKNTKPETIVRSMAHSLGYRFRLHRRDLPGTPDIVFPRLRRIILVHGCFWHQHRGCGYAYKPKSNSPFWEKKFASNLARDQRDARALRQLGWDVLIVWECESKKPERLLRRLGKFLSADKAHS
jgi:DNA mismatch endonuclease (patch repair protein)